MTAPGSLPQVIASFWQDICKQPPVSPAAQAQVLDAVRSQNSQLLSSDQAAAVGDPSISEAEVYAALKATAPGKAPGWDGIPANLFFFSFFFSRTSGRAYAAGLFWG